jgi:hypothetical protein
MYSAAEYMAEYQSSQSKEMRELGLTVQVEVAFWLAFRTEIDLFVEQTLQRDRDS